MPSNRDVQLSQIIETQSAHQQLIGLTKTFKCAREIQGKVLRELSSPNRILLLGPGEGDEAQFLFAVAGIDPNNLELVVIEASKPRASVFQNQFPSATVVSADFSDGDLHLDRKADSYFDVIQLGFVLNDQTERGKVAILDSCYKALQNSGTIIIAEPLMCSNPNLAALLKTTEEIEAVNLELREYYETCLLELDNMSDYSPEIRLPVTESIRRAWSDALEHNEGRETFDTRATLETKLRQTGFVCLRFFDSVNKVAIVVAEKHV